MREQKQRKQIKRCICWFLTLSIILSTTATDGRLFQGLFHWEISKEAKAATGQIPDNTILDQKVVPDAELLSYLRQKVQKADSTIQHSNITVKNLALLVTSDLEIPASVSDLTGLGWARSAASFDISQCTKVTAVAVDEFNSCSMTTVTLPSTVKTINQSAFKSCSNLKTINLSGVDFIGDDAFAGCTALTDEGAVSSLKTTMEYLGSGAFQGCRSLSQVTVPVITNSFLNHTVPAKLFSNCSDLEKITFQDSELRSISDSAFEGTDNLIFKVPSDAEYGYKLPSSVAFLGESVFMNSQIENLDLSNTSVTAIQKTTFYKAVLSSGILLPASLISIGEEAFCYSSLKEIVMPNTVTTLDAKCFQYTKYLGKVVLSKNISVIPNAAFQGAGTTSLIAGEGVNYNPGSNSGDASTFLKISYNDSTPAESALKEIQAMAFNCSMAFDDSFLKGLVNLTTIGEGAFAYTEFKSLTVPSCVTTLGAGAFNGMYWLEEMYFAEGSRITEFPDNLFGQGKKYTDKMAYSDINLKTVQLPSGLVSIGSNCFGYCISLNTVGYPGKMTAGEVNLPSTLKTIGTQAFSYCSVFSTKGVTLLFKVLPFSNGGLNIVNIPDSVTMIGNGAFKGSTTLTTLRLGNGITEIPDELCYRCGAYPTDNKENAQLTGTSSPAMNEKDYTPIDFVGLTNVVLPDNVTRIGKNAFYECYGMKLDQTGTLPSQLGEISDYAFYRCKSLDKVVFPTSLKTIGNYAFAEAAQFIDEEYYSPSKQYKIPHQYAGLKTADFTYATNLDTIGKFAFSKTNLTRISFPDNVVLIPESVCDGCYNLETVAEMSNNVTKIENNAFRNCFRLNSATLPFSAEWSKTIFSEAAANMSNRLTLIPTQESEDVQIHYGRDMSLTLNCFKNFTSTTLTLTDSDKENSDPKNNLLLYDNNDYISASLNASSQINLFGKKLGDTSVKVTGKIDLFSEKLNANEVAISISHIYNVSVTRVPVTELVIDSKDFIARPEGKTLYISCNDTKAKTIKAVYDPEDTTDNVEWSVGNSNVVSIDSQGNKDGTSSAVIRAMGVGDTVLKVATDAVSDTCNISVRVPANQIKLSSSTMTLATGGKHQLNAVLTYPSDYVNEAVSYPDIYEFTSSNPAVATVDSVTGLVNAVSDGTARITAKCMVSGRAATCSITVKTGYVPRATSISMDQSEASLQIGSKLTLSAQVLPAEADQTLAWTSTNEKVATVTNGIVTAVSVGTVTITAVTNNNLKATCRVMIKSSAKGLKIRSVNGNTKKVYLKKKGTVTLGKYYSNGNCTDTFKFSAKKNKIGTVTENGQVKAGKKTGKFIVYLSAYDGKQRTARTKVTVYVGKKDIKAKKVNIKGAKKVKAGKRIFLTATVKPKNSTTGITWRTNNIAIATVDSYGAVTGVKKGKAKIIATATNGKKKTVTITVK